MLPGARQDPGDGDLRVPAFGRNARLGYLYDERRDEFQGVSIFSGDIPTEVIKKTQTPYLSVKYDLSNTYEQKFKLFNIEASVSANILSGQLKVEGSASYLKDENRSSRDVTGLMLYESHTVSEDLQIYYTSLQSLYNTELLQDKSATHLVTGIKWGGNVVIKCSQTAADGQDLEKVGGKLKVEFEKLKGTFSISAAASVKIDATDKSENTEFNLSIRGDISIPDQFPTTYEEVQSLIQKVPELIRNTNDSKGIPVEFTLTPLSSLRRHLETTAQENVFARKIEESRLNDFVSIFDEISYIERKINDHYDTLTDNEICVPPSVRRSIVSLRQSFKTAKMSFTTALKDTLRKVRSGLAPETALADLSTRYQTQEFSSANVQNKLLDFKESLLKVQLYQQIQKSFPRITYFGRDGDLEASLWDSKDDVVYLLYMKQELKDEEPQLWKENRKIFTETLYRPFNKLFLLDCDFDSEQFQDVRRTRIEQLVKGVTTIPDVHLVMSRSQEREPLQWKALGRVAELGDLFDARTDTFLQDTSFLKDKYPESIVHVTTQDREDVHDFPSESFPDKFRVLGVEPEQQFSIFAQLQPRTRTGHYFQDCYPTQFYKTSPQRSFLHSRYLKSQEIKIMEPDLWKHLAVQAVDKGATHFVSRIDYGINSIFSIEDPELEESQRNLSFRSLETEPVKSDSRLRSFVDSLKSNILARTPLDNDELPGVFTVKISSDVQGETSIPYTFTSQSQLREFLNTKFIPMLGDPEAKGQIPIAYVLYPVSNLVHKLGIISPSISYGTLSNPIENSACPKDIAMIFERIHLARKQIQQVEECFHEHRQYITDQDLSAFKEIEREFSEALAFYAGRIRSTIADFKKCGKEESSRESLSLEALVTEFKSKEFFDSSLRYNELGKLQLIENKIQFCLQLRDMENNFLGRESKSVSFNEIVTRHCEGDTRLYFLYYHPTWPRDHGDLWRETFSFFCGELRRRTHPAQKLYVVNCEFSYPHSEQVTKPVIHEYRKGKLTCHNVVDTRIDEEVTLQMRMTQLEGKIHAMMKEGLKLSESRITNLEKAVYKNLSYAACAQLEDKLKSVQTIEMLINEAKNDPSYDVSKLGRLLIQVQNSINILENAESIRLPDSQKDLLGKLLEDPELFAFAQELQRNGRITDALTLFEIIHASQGVSLPSDDANGLPALFHIARNHLLREDFSQALPLLRVSHQHLMSSLGPDHKDTARVEYYIGFALQNLGRYKEARSIYKIVHQKDIHNYDGLTAQTMEAKQNLDFVIGIIGPN